MDAITSGLPPQKQGCETQRGEEKRGEEGRGGERRGPPLETKGNETCDIFGPGEFIQGQTYPFVVFVGSVSVVTWLQGSEEANVRPVRGLNTGAGTRAAAVLW